MWRCSLKAGLERLLRPHGKSRFIGCLPLRARLLDVGCGNNSPYHIKRQRPDIYYVGIDITGQGATPVSADQYVEVSSEAFAPAIANMAPEFDGVISSHNLEHCHDPAATLLAMMKVLKKGGALYLAFPCKESAGFPHRAGSLNFHDDSTHRLCPDLQSITSAIKAQGFRIEFLAPRYRPFMLALIGLVLEPVSFLTRRTMPFGSTWALYGFESILWARRSD